MRGRVPPGASRGQVRSRAGFGRLAAAAALVAVLVLALGGPFTPVARAASVTFDTPTATSHFGTGITFAQSADAGGVTVERVEILITVPGAQGPDVTEVPFGSNGELPATLTYTLDTSQGQLFPNTVVSARWRIVDANGNMTVGPTVTVTYLDTRFAWRTKAGSIVRVHWYQGDDAFASRALAIGEAGIAKASALLGVTETQPVDFYIYADQGPFGDALGPGSRENVGGEAVPEIRTLFALITPDEVNDSWVGIVIPHELTHLVFDTATRNPYHDPPHWLNEGLAVYLSQGNDPTDRATLSAAIADQTVMPLSALVGEFPTAQEQFFLAYAEAVSAVDFMVSKYGKAAVVKLIRSYASGVTDDEAFKAALGVTTSGFDAAWLAKIGARTPQRYGPVAAPAGPVPPGWTTTGATSGTGAAPLGDAGAAAPAPRSSGSTDGLAQAALATVGASLVLGLLGLFLLRRRTRAGGGGQL